MATKAELILDQWAKDTPTPKLLCSHCLRPMPTELEYVCQECGANHYKGQFYICCPYDATMPLDE